LGNPRNRFSGFALLSQPKHNRNYRPSPAAEIVPVPFFLLRSVDGSPVKIDSAEIVPVNEVAEYRP
jgi:hypothetical protein